MPVVARRSGGSASVRDTAMRVGTFPGGSAAFYLYQELAHAGLTGEDVRMIPMAQAGELSRALIAREIDAIAIWEPASQEAFDALEADAVELRTPGRYRSEELALAEATAAAGGARHRDGR